MKYKFLFIAPLILLLWNCQRIPQTKFPQWKQTIDVDVSNDSLRLGIDNPIHCPLRVFPKSADEAIQQKVDKTFPIVLLPKTDTIISLYTNKTKEELNMKFSVMMGDPNATIHKMEINLPFQKGYQYKVIQGYNGQYSHTSDYSKYAIDFNLKEGDTICAVADGYVVGVIEGYSEGGKSKKWRDYANFITVFHPEMNLYTQYVHLVHNGSLVEVGDDVKAKQAIALSGKTGHTDMEHLHFNVLKPNESGMESVTIEFKEGFKGSEMKRGDLIGIK